MEIRNYKKGDIISADGALEPWIFELRKGEADIFMGYGTEKEVKLKSIAGGTLFGEMGYFSGAPRTGTVICASETAECGLIRNEDIEQYTAENPEKILTITKTLALGVIDLYKKLGALQNK